ncbi:hypothetical protein [Porticoccus sp.]
MIKRLALPVLVSIGLVGCVSNQPKQVIALNNPTLGAKQVALEICRPASITRSVEAPDLYIDGQNVAEIANGTSFKVETHVGAGVKLFLEKNMLVYRFKDTTIYSDSLESDPLFLIVSAEANIKEGISVLLGGAIAESARQYVDEKSVSDSWSVLAVSEEVFRTECPN